MDVTDNFINETTNKGQTPLVHILSILSCPAKKDLIRTDSTTDKATQAFREENIRRLLDAGAGQTIKDTAEYTARLYAQGLPDYPQKTRIIKMLIEAENAQNALPKSNSCLLS